MEKAFIPKRDVWSAQWVWLERGLYPDRQKCRATVFCPDEYPFTVALLRKTFELPFVPDKATAWLSADTKYRCWINGKLVARGPAKVGGDFGNCDSPDWWFYDGIELGQCLRKGINVVAFDVLLGPQVQADYSMGRGGLLFELQVAGQGGKRFCLCSDETWRATLSSAETEPNVYDARQEIPFWMGADYDDSHWRCAESIGTVAECPWPLLPREIPMLAEGRVPPIDIDDQPVKEHTFALKRQIKHSQTMTLRFPCELAGYVYLDVEGGAGSRMEIDFCEQPGNVSGRRETYILSGDRRSYESRRLQGFEYIQVRLLFADLEPGGGNVTLHAIGAVSSSFPVAYCGCFSCSDAFLNQLWVAGRWTTQLCMQSCHLDSPIHQEGLGCTGDYMIASLISYYCFGETRLARKDILRTAYLLKQKGGRMFHTSYSLLWVWMLRDYWFYSGDKETLAEVMDCVHMLLGLFRSYVGGLGLVTEAPNYMFMDWVQLGAYSLHHPPASIGQGYMSAFYYRALLYASELSLLRGEAAHAQDYDKRAAALKKAFHDHLWRPEKGIYRDGVPGVSRISPNRWMPADAAAESFTVHTNILAVAVGIAPIDKQASIMDQVLTDNGLPAVQPYFMHFVFEALAVAGLFEKYAFDLMERWKPLLAEHPSSLKETWDGGDYSHAWGGSPTYHLSKHVLGVSCTTPCFRSFRLQPRLGSLREAKGVIPTMHGLIHIGWRREGKTIKGEMSGPAGCEVTLQPPEYTDVTNIAVYQKGEAPPLHSSADGAVRWVLNKATYGISIECAEL